MKAIDNIDHQNILPQYERHSSREIFLSALRQWRQRLGYLSIFTAAPVMWTSQVPEARANDAVGPDERRAQPDTNSRGQLRSSCSKPAFLKRQTEYRLPHQKGSYNVVDVLAGNDDCPGRAIPGGNYTASAPYTDSGNTTGANNTISYAGDIYYCYYGFQAEGPDHIYSFTLTGLGANPKIQVSRTSGNYAPLVYILDGQGATSCPSGTGNTNCGMYTGADSRFQGGSGVATIDWMEYLPLNVPLRLVVDSRLNDGSAVGPYTLRMEDVTISPAQPNRQRFDFDGDGKADTSVYRASGGRWYLQGSASGPAVVPWGAATDKIVPADYDRDGKTDLAVFRPSEGRWYILNSNNGTASGLVWGNATDIPAPGDFDDDGKVDVAVFRASNGTVYVRESLFGDGYGLPVGQNGDIPVTGDYDGDGHSDFAVFRPSTGAWIIRPWNNNVPVGYQYGLNTDKVVPADYDGDGTTDIAVYRPSEGRWYIANSNGPNPTLHTAVHFGTETDIPVPADYDGDGRADIAIFRPSDGNWWINRSTAGLIVIHWGQNGDKPTPNAYGN